MKNKENFTSIYEGFNSEPVIEGFGFGVKADSATSKLRRHRLPALSRDSMSRNSTATGR